MNTTTRYPVQYRCDFCSNSGFAKKDGKPNGTANPTCPTCRFGVLKKMNWNGMRWC